MWFESSILGEKKFWLPEDQYPSKIHRAVLTTYPTEVNDAIKILCQLKAQEGIGCIDLEGSLPRQRAIMPSRKLNLDSPQFHSKLKRGIIQSDQNFTFLLSQRDDFPKTSRHSVLINWALVERIPYVHVHDNDHAWWSGFHHQSEKTIFLFWLAQSCLRIAETSLTLSRSDWKVLRYAIYEKGFLLDPTFASLKNGTIRLVLKSPAIIPLARQPCKTIPTASMILIIEPSGVIQISNHN